MNKQDRILKKLRQIDILPTFPKIVAEILTLIDDPMSSASDLARHMDPSMTGEVLRIANTAYFGTRSFRSITTIERGIAVIGYEHLANVILQMPFLGMIQGSDETFDKKLFITHAIACGALSKLIGSMAAGPADHNEIYISGILHDIGRIIMYRHFKAEWQEMMALIKGRHAPALAAEHEVFGVDHGHIGASLLELWNLPSAIINGVRYHHLPDQATEYRESAYATWLGNQLSKRIDLEADLAGFDEFAAKHREFCQLMKDCNGMLVSHDEVKFLSEAYECLRNAKGLIDVTTGSDDTGPGSR